MNAAQGALGIADADFHAAPLQAAQAQVDRIDDEDFEGLLLDGPRLVDMKQHEGLTLVGVRRSSIQHNVEHPLKSRATLVAVRQESGETVAGRAFYQKEPPPPPPPGKPSKGFVSKAFDIGLPRLPKGLFTLPWRPGTYTFRVLVHDQHSNPVTCELTQGKVDDPEVSKFLDAMRAPDFPQAVHPPLPRPLPEGAAPRPGERLPSYQRAEGSPEPPAKAGVALSVERVVVNRPYARCVLRGAFRLPLRPRFVVRPRPPEGDPARERWRDVGDPQARAVLPITLVLTGDQWPGPWAVPLQVPVHADATGTEVVGWFNVDLFRLLDAASLQPDTYALRAFASGGEGGPVLMAIVSEAMLPPPGE